MVQHIIRPIAGGGRLELTAVNGHRSPASTAHAGVDEDTGGPLAGAIEMAAVDGQPAIVACTNRRGHLVGVGLIRAVYRAGLALAAVIDSQVALLAADINNGISIGSIAFILCIKLPDSKSAPLAICAFIILSVSSTSIGINLSAIDIIIAISCTGTFILFNGFNSFSSASVS